MITKTLIAILALTIVSSTYAATSIIDPATSKLVYLAKKLTGEHTGEVKIKNGHLNFEKDLLTSGDFEIDMTTIINSDIQNPEYHTKFINHIVSDDFFSTLKFKTSKLVIKSVKKNKGTNYSITADLTIKDITAPITFDAEVTKEKANAVVVFDRTTYGIKYGSGKFFQNLGDKMIMDNVQLTVSLTTKI
jgi:polyisoprenoid-binding protein YceI